MITAIRPGLIFDLPMADYIAAPGVSKHALDYIAKSPRHYHDYVTGRITQEQTDRMLFGQLLHALVLEGKANWACKPLEFEGRGKSNTNEYREWKAAQTMPIIDGETEKELWACAELIQGHELASNLGTFAKSEVSMFALDPQFKRFMLKGRADLLSTQSLYIADLKCTTDASTGAFSREIASRRYHVQAGLYVRICRLLGYEIKDFYFIALERGPVPRINVRRLADDAVALGGEIAWRNLDTLAGCLERDEWPEYCDKDGDIEEINVPEWEHNRLAPQVDLVIGGETFKA